MEQRLEGGNMTAGVVRVGETVRRPRGPRSDFAADAVAWLNARGFPFTGRYLGIDDQGRDTFEYVEGVTTEHPAQRDEGSYAAMAHILRELHELTADSELAGPGASLLHGDPGPFNVICREGMPVALIDWDSAHVGDPLDDVGYAAWTWCTSEAGGTTAEEQARRLCDFRDAYDPTMTPTRLFGAITRAQQRMILAEGEVLEDPLQGPARKGHAERAIRWAETDSRYLARHRGVFEVALGESILR